MASTTGGWGGCVGVRLNARHVTDYAPDASSTHISGSSSSGGSGSGELLE